MQVFVNSKICLELCRWGLRKQKETDVNIELHVPEIQFDVPLPAYVHHFAEEPVTQLLFAQSVN